MIGWVLDFVPLWVWIALGIGALIATWQLFGLKGMIAAAAAIGTLGAYRAGRKTGGADAIARQKKADEKAVKDHDKIEAETDRMSDSELDGANAPWVRNRRK